MKSGFLLDPEKKKAKKVSTLGPLSDERALPSTYGGLTARKPSTSWGSQNLASSSSTRRSWGSRPSAAGDSSLGKAPLDWKLPSTVTTGTTNNSATGWRSRAPVPTTWGSSDSATVSTFASTIPTVESISSDRSSIETAPSTAAWSAPPPRPNPFAGVPLSRINKTAGVPKAALHSVYGRPPRRKVISQDDYHTWHDGGPPHQLKFTSIFCCPATGECFPSGRYGSTALHQVDERGTVWYTKKALAEHGAAARAFDCLSLRDCAVGMVPELIGDDTPYIADQSPLLQSMVVSNSGILQTILSSQERIRQQQQQQSSSQMDVDSDEEAAWRTRPADDKQLTMDLFG